MAFTRTLSQICIFLTALYSVAHSQGTSLDPNLFANLLSSTPQTGPTSGGAPDLSAMLTGSNAANPMATSTNTGFSPSTFPNSMPPNPGFPTMTGPMSMPMNAQPQAQASTNPMQSLMPYFLFRGSDFGQMMAMASMFNRGGSSSGGGGLLSNPFMLFSFMNNM